MSSTAPSEPGERPDGSFEPTSRVNRKAVLASAGLVGVLAVGAAGTWAATSFMGSGAQPAAAMPADTLGYVGIDLDPSGGQKLAALQTLRKFPALKERLAGGDEDLRRVLFESLTDSAGCSGLDYAKDIEPWLGSRAGAGFREIAKGEPAPIVVVQVTDAAAAKRGIDGLRDACGDGDEELAVVVEGDWAVLAETVEAAESAHRAAEVGSLAEDPDFTKWTQEAGGAGVVNIFVAPEAASAMVEAMRSMDPEGAAIPEGAEQELLEEFEGAAGVVRFADGGLELELAGKGGALAAKVGQSTSADPLEGVRSLPDDTVLAVGAALPEGWFDEVGKQAADAAGQSPEQFFAELSEGSGLDLPADAETLLGQVLTLSLGGGDLAALFEAQDPSVLPLGIKVKGDPAAIEAVLDKLRPQLGPDASLLETETAGTSVVLGPNSEYRAAVARGGNLGSSDAFRSAVAEVDNATVVMFVNADEALKAFSGRVDQKPGLKQNLEPLSGVGLVGWSEGDVTHARLRIATD